ncbi:MAG: 16S rRNA (guanine(527)-N(7))-methyltransferase RsmG [Microthrixaceae bacterium]
MPVDPAIDRFIAAGVRHDLIGDPAPEVHVANAEAFASQLDLNGSVLDLGSGAGLPGLLLARLRPDLSVTLVDASARRCRFLVEWCDEIAPDTQVVHGRAEVVARDPLHHRAYDFVTARSFGPPAVTAECAVGFLRLAGRLLVSEPPGGLDDRWPEAGIEALGLSGRGLHTSGSTTIKVLELIRPDDRFPRRDGRPAKRPLF